jgi:plasmid segregation protein ParM
MAFWDILQNKNEEKEEVQKLIVGSDLGYGQVKVLSGDMNLKFPSAVGNPISDFGRTAAISNEEELLNSLTITLDGTKYYVGHNALVNTRNGRFSLRQNKSETESNKVKFITSLALLTQEDQEYAEFDVISGLPVLEYKNQKDSLERMMYNNGKPFELTMHYGPKEVQKQLKINTAKVITQGEGAFYDFVLNENGQIMEERANDVSGQVMVVDVGFRTTDIVTMENGSYIEIKSDQLNKGVVQIHQECLRLIMERLGIKKELNDMDEIVRNGEIYHNREYHNVTDIIEDAARPFAADIVDNLHLLSNDQLGSMQRILITGGGASIISQYVQELLNNVIKVSAMNNAEFSNPNGYYKYGLLLKNNGGL